MQKSVYKRKGNFKGLLFVLGLLLIAAILIYTQQQVDLLQQNSREYLHFRIRVMEDYLKNPDSNIDFNFFLTEVIQGTDYPIIYTDTAMVPYSCKNVDTELDTMRFFTAETRNRLTQYLKAIDAENKPIPIQWEGRILGYMHYGVSPVITKLRWLPYIEITGALLFILIGYIGFSQIKKSEQRYIWVGMAKETAHQLGTPLSSLIGWIDLLKEDQQNISQALPEMETDAARLNKVAARFSQIGSVPSLKQEDIVKIIGTVVEYFRKRLPQYEHKIVIKEHYQVRPVLYINPDLFEWVLENIIKNAVDAIKSKSGEILISIANDPKEKYINIDIRDTGTGIIYRDQKNVFKPGFSTKRRGWGLGLSLAKRIIEDYHQGKLFILESRVDKGSTFRIMLKTDGIS
jgi:signal transduction histidine kinase